MKHFLSTVDWTKEELQDILDYSKYLKTNRFQDSLKNKSVGLVFFNPPLIVHSNGHGKGARYHGIAS